MSQTLTESQASSTPQQEQQQDRYIELIDRLLKCPNGQEPEILDQSAELLNAEFVQTLMQVASYFAHQDQPDTAKFLIFTARELANQLGLYPRPSANPPNDSEER